MDAANSHDRDHLYRDEVIPNDRPYRRGPREACADLANYTATIAKANSSARECKFARTQIKTPT